VSPVAVQAIEVDSSRELRVAPCRDGHEPDAQPYSCRHCHLDATAEHSSWMPDDVAHYPRYLWFAKIGAALWSVTIANVSNGDRRDDRDDGRRGVGRVHARSRASAAFSRAWGSR